MIHARQGASGATGVAKGTHPSHRGRIRRELDGASPQPVLRHKGRVYRAEYDESLSPNLPLAASGHFALPEGLTAANKVAANRQTVPL